jgi:outer membrane protein
VTVDARLQGVVIRWQSSAPYLTAAATAAETSFSAAQRELTKRFESEITDVHSRDHFPNYVPRSATDPMKSKFLRLLPAVAALFALSALAQTGNAATPPDAPGAKPSAPATTTTPGPGGVKVGTINIQEAIAASNEGQRDLGALQKKFEPKQTELKSQNDELDALKKQLQTQGASLNEDAANNLKGQIENKQKAFDRSVQDAQEDYGNQEKEIAGRILKKMAPIVVKYSQDNGFGLIVDTSQPWPQSPVLWWNPDSMDITKAVVEAYNAQSGVAPPAAPTKPTAPKPSTGSATKPPSSSQPK